MKIFRINPREQLLYYLKRYFEGDNNNTFSINSYINYKCLAKIIWYRLKKIKKHMAIDYFDLRTIIGTTNPLATTFAYGILNRVLPNSIYFLNETIPIKDYYIKIIPTFSSQKTLISFTGVVNISTFYMLYQYISIKRRLKKYDKCKSASDRILNENGNGKYQGNG